MVVMIVLDRHPRRMATAACADARLMLLDA
jgi:hypothetical protein